jgi:hypothetical protein
MTAQTLITVGVLGLLVVGSISSETQSESAPWFQMTQNALSVAMLSGAALLWIFAWKFYVRVQMRLGVTRHLLYIAILLGLTVFSPLVFMIIEGKDSFFGEAFA